MMPIRYYMDVHVDRRVTCRLRGQGVDIVTAQEDGSDTLADADLLDRAGMLGRVLVTEDRDFLREAGLRQRDGRPFIGIIFVRASRMSLRQYVEDLALLAEAEKPEAFANQVRFVPI